MQPISLTKGQTAYVDDADFEKVSGHSWYAMKSSSRSRTTYYAASRINKKIVLMHRMLMDAPAGLHVDHQDGDGLNNCRENLRICTPSQNSGNRGPSYCNSGYKGVGRDRNSFIAYIHTHGRKRHLGSFRNAEDAARAYDAAAKEYYGEFARLNLP